MYVPMYTGVGAGRTGLAVAAGFDAAANDPIGGCEITPAGFAHMTHQLLGVADGRVILALEVRPPLASTQAHRTERG